MNIVGIRKIAAKIESHRFDNIDDRGLLIMYLAVRYFTNQDFGPMKADERFSTARAALGLSEEQAAQLFAPRRATVENAVGTLRWLANSGDVMWE